MLSSSSNSSAARTRSLRVPQSSSLKPTAASTSRSAAGSPSNITLFLTSLRLLDLDLRDDWPDITVLTFSTKDAQQNQKKRVQCVEWALYQLFSLLDPEDARNKLQPFFPPLEQLQSLNLRSALFRSLDQAKKNGLLGRDTVLRKSMLDDCKGERLEEILAVFSNVVLKKVLGDADPGQRESIARRMALANSSYSAERTGLSSLVLAHKASLSKHIGDRQASRAKYQDFSDLLNLHDRRIDRRHEQLKEHIEEHRTDDGMSQKEVENLQAQVRKNWSGSDEWLESVLYGDNRVSTDDLLATPFDAVWKLVDDGNIGEVEGKLHVGLLEQLDARVKDQADRLSRWKSFGKTLSKVDDKSPSKLPKPTLAESQRFDLSFNLHQTLQIGGVGRGKPSGSTATASFQEYARLIENMKAELAGVGKPKAQVTQTPRRVPEKRQSLQTSPVLSREDSPTHDEQWSSASSEDEDQSPGFTSYATKSISLTPPSETPATLPLVKEVTSNIPPINQMLTSSETERVPRPGNGKYAKDTPDARRGRADQSLLRGRSRSRTPPPKADPKPTLPVDSESDDLADQILNSVSTASPSPKKPRHTLSLAERTRLSMSRASHSHFSDLHEDLDELPDLPRLPPKQKPGPDPAKKLVSEPDGGKHADLIERTRKSMAGFEAAQRNAQAERRKSIKDAKRRTRESSYFPKVEEEVVTADVSAMDLIEGDPDYESVFKSRPKIKTSPAASPSRIWEDEDED